MAKIVVGINNNPEIIPVNQEFGLLKIILKGSIKEVCLLFSISSSDDFGVMNSIATAGIIYSKIRTRKSALISMAIATATFALMSCPFNYFITLPLYSQVLGFSNEAIIGMSAAVNPLIHTKFDLILWGFLPFNIFKGVVISAITLVIYKPISKLINATAEKTK